MVGAEGGRSAGSQSPNASGGPLGSELVGGLRAVVEEKGWGGAVDGAGAAVGLDEFSLEEVVKEGLGVEAEDTGSALGGTYVWPGIAQRDECVARGPPVESTLGAEVTDVELCAAGE